MRTIVSTILCAIACAAASGQAQVRAWLDPDTVQVGRAFRIMVEAEGGTVDEPVLPEVDHIQVETRPSITETSWSFTGLKRRQAIRRGYNARATETGSLEIPPISVVVDGKTYRTESLTLTVTESAQPLRGVSDRSRTRSRTQDDQSGTLGLDDVVILEAGVDKEDVFVNEPVVLTLSRWRLFHHQVQVRDFNEVDPSTEGFYVIPVQQGYGGVRPDIHTRGGWRYRVEEKRLMLCPTSPGELTIGPWQYNGVALVRNGFDIVRENIHCTSEPLTIRVSPLPKPPGSFTGAVGQFSAAASLIDRDVVQGVPAKLRVTITGRGNPNAIGHPTLPELDGASVADPDAQVRGTPDPAEPLFEKEFIYGITPFRAGALAIPAFEFCYFDPDSTRYVTQTLGPFSLEVLPASDPQRRLVVDKDAQPEKQGTVDVIGVDIRPVVTDPGVLRRNNPSPVTTPALVLTPVAAYAGLALVMTRRRRFEQDIGFARRYRAHAAARRRLRSALQAREPADALCRAVIGYVADKCNVSEAGITSSDVEALLQSKQIDQDLLDNVLKILRACERARYASAELSPQEIDALIAGAHSNVDALERALKGGRRT